LSTSEPLLLRPNRGKWLPVVLGSLGFVLAGVWLMDAHTWVASMSIAFFGLCFLVSVVQLLPGAAYLRLSPDGFTVCSLFREHTIRWADVKEFSVGRVLLHKMVMFNFEGSAGSFPRSQSLRSLNVKLCGFEAGLPDTYGLPHNELAALLSDRKASAHGA